jgi:hypothetical protein
LPPESSYSASLRCPPSADWIMPPAKTPAGKSSSPPAVVSGSDDRALARADESDRLLAGAKARRRLERLDQPLDREEPDERPCGRPGGGRGLVEGRLFPRGGRLLLIGVDRDDHGDQPDVAPRRLVDVRDSGLAPGQGRVARGLKLTTLLARIDPAASGRDAGVGSDDRDRVQSRTGLLVGKERRRGLAGRVVELPDDLGGGEVRQPELLRRELVREPPARRRPRSRTGPRSAGPAPAGSSGPAGTARPRSRAAASAPPRRRRASGWTSARPCGRSWLRLREGGGR